MTSLSQNLGLTASALSFFLSGAISSISLLSIPSIVSVPLQPRTAMQLWKSVYDLGKVQAPIIALGASILHLASAYSRSSEKSWREVDARSIAAAVLTMGIAPFTLVAMAGTNSVLIAGAEGARKLEEEGVKALLGKWGRLNLMRSVLPLIGGVLGVVASVGRA